VLTDLTQLGHTWEWTSIHKQAFCYLCNALTKDPILCQPDFSWLFEMQTNMSQFAISANLTQQDDNGCKYVVAYAICGLADYRILGAPTKPRRASNPSSGAPTEVGY